MPKGIKGALKKANIISDHKPQPPVSPGVDLEAARIAQEKAKQEAARVMKEKAAIEAEAARIAQEKAKQEAARVMKEKAAIETEAARTAQEKIKQEEMKKLKELSENLKAEDFTSEEGYQPIKHVEYHEEL